MYELKKHLFPELIAEKELQLFLFDLHLKQFFADFLLQDMEEPYKELEELDVESTVAAAIVSSDELHARRVV